MGLLYNITNKAYLLDSSREKDTPVPIFKSISQLIEENLTIIIVLTLISSTALLFFLYIRKKKDSKITVQEPTLIDPFKEALENNESLQNQTPPLSSKPFVFRLSEILRIYIERVFEVPAMELTGEEFMREITDHSFFRNKYDHILQEFINQGDRIKYSNENAGEVHMNQLLETALHIVKDTNAALSQEKQMASNSQTKV